VTLLEFLLCTAVLAAVAEWQVPASVQYVALGGVLLFAYALLDGRSATGVLALGRLAARLRHVSGQLLFRVRLAVMLNSPVLRQPEMRLAPSPAPGAEWSPFGERDSSSEPEEETPALNDACWCGSGKKYKKCHGRDLVSVRIDPSKVYAFRARSLS